MEEAQSLSVKRAEVEWHNFAALGEPERVFAAYNQQNLSRGALIRAHLPFIRELTPFLEIGACAGQTSYLLTNAFAADGFALDISADALRWGVELMSQWDLHRAPVRTAGDALHLPFRDGSLRVVLAYQMLSQFQDIEAVFLEVKRVLAPGGIFLFGEEPLRRAATLRLYRAPYERQMTAWERKLNDWGLLGYLVRDVIGAHQEESFGIRQNHRMTLKDWDNLVRKHFSEHRVRDLRPWARLGRTLDEEPRAQAGPGRLGVARRPPPRRHVDRVLPEVRQRVDTVRREAFRSRPAVSGLRRRPFARRTRRPLLRLRLCGGEGRRRVQSAALGRAQRAVPGRPAGHPRHEPSRAFGAARRRLARPRRRLRQQVPLDRQTRYGTAGPGRYGTAAAPHPRLCAGLAKVTASVNGTRVREMKVDRPGLFVLEADVPDAPSYELEILASPVIQTPKADDRELTVNLSMIRLVPRD